MAARGPYAKGVAKRAEILEVALEVIDRNGYSSATVKELADAVGLSQNGLLHYFGSKDQLFLEILRHQRELLSTQIGTDPHAFIDDFDQRIIDAANAAATAPGLIQLTLRLGMEAAEPDHPAHEFFKSRYEDIRKITRGAIEDLRDSGRIAPDVDPHIAGTLIYAALEGLQIQWSYDTSIDMGAHIAYLVSALGLSQQDATLDQREKAIRT